MILDTLWNAWVAPLPDVWTDPWFAAVRDAMTLLLGVVSAGLAYKAWRVGREQVRIAEMQTRITLIQHETAVALSKKRPSLSLSWSVQPRDEAATWVAEIEITNSGDRPIESLRWELNLMLWRKYEVDIPSSVEDKSVHSLAGAPGDKGGLFARVHGYVKDPIFPEQVFILGTVKGLMADRPVVAYWRLDTAAGRFPADATYGRLSLFDWAEEDEDDDVQEPISNS